MESADQPHKCARRYVWLAVIVLALIALAVAYAVS
jgi:hypothetical protein